ncbi:hypothetical protein Ga0451573_002151 [Peptococcaceae bacterium DYL19]|nr:hypothetical protein [Phosphitispora fastidiosa]
MRGVLRLLTNLGFFEYEKVIWTGVDEFLRRGPQSVTEAPAF